MAISLHSMMTKMKSFDGLTTTESMANLRNRIQNRSKIKTAVIATLNKIGNGVYQIPSNLTSYKFLTLDFDISTNLGVMKKTVSASGDIYTVTGGINYWETTTGWRKVNNTITHFGGSMSSSANTMRVLFFDGTNSGISIPNPISMNKLSSSLSSLSTTIVEYELATCSGSGTWTIPTKYRTGGWQYVVTQGGFEAGQWPNGSAMRRWWANNNTEEYYMARTGTGIGFKRSGNSITIGSAKYIYNPLVCMFFRTKTL